MFVSPLQSRPENVLSVQRALVAAGVGALAGSSMVVAGEPELMPIVGWIVAAAVALVWAWRIIWPLDPAGTELLAEAEARARTTDSAILAACGISVGAVVLALIRYTGDHGAAATTAVLLSVASVALSWLLVNTVFALKYARLYYIDDDGGLDFHQSEPPRYSDFAYVAFSIGMSFGPAEVEPTTADVRKVALGHALLSYLLATGLLAVAVNLVANLGQS